MRPDAVVLVSFGVADDAARRASMDALFEEMAGAFAESEARQAFTSNFIRRRLAARGLSVESLEEALAVLAAAGARRVLVQPTHLTAGEEYEKKICAAVHAARGRFERLVLGETLLTGEADYARLRFALHENLPLSEGEELVLLGHGSPHRHNPVYARLQAYLDSAGARVHVGVVEPSDTPNFDDVRLRLQRSGVREIVLAPLLFAGGVHVIKDMAGEGDSSWKARFEQAGVRVRPVFKGLGEYAAIRQIYIAKAQTAWGQEE